MTTDVPSAKCVRCGYTMDQATSAYEERKPDAGSVSICYSCGLIRIFADDLTLRDPTPEEQRLIDNDPMLAKLVRIIIGRQ
jgi:hypothetical protein